MSYTIKKIPDLNIIKAIVNGTLSSQERKELHLKCVTEANTTGYQRILLDVQNSVVSSEYNVNHSIDMAEYMKDFELSKKTKFAFLTSGKDTPHGTFAVFARIISDMEINAFTDYDEAIQWLCQD